MAKAKKKAKSKVSRKKKPVRKAVKKALTAAKKVVRKPAPKPKAKAPKLSSAGRPPLLYPRFQHGKPALEVHITHHEHEPLAGKRAAVMIGPLF